MFSRCQVDFVHTLPILQSSEVRPREVRLRTGILYINFFQLFRYAIFKEYRVILRMISMLFRRKWNGIISV